jgi:hypothetical protein
MFPGTGTKEDPMADPDTFKFRSIYIASSEWNAPQWRTGRCTIAMRVFADVGAKRYEFVRLDVDAGKVEVYDYPKAWKGLARFVGYMSAEKAVRLHVLACERVRRLPVMPSQHEHDVVRLEGAT